MTTQSNQAQHNSSDSDTALIWEHTFADSARWLHFQSDHTKCRSALHRLDLPQSVVAIMTASETRPRFLQVAEGLLIILRGVNTNPGAHPEDMVSLRIWICDDLIVTSRKNRRPLQSVMDVKSRLGEPNGPQSPVGVFGEILIRIADRIEVVVDEFDGKLVRLERHIENSNYHSSRASLTECRIKSAALRRYLAPQREALEALYRERSPILGSEDHVVRDQSDRMTRYVEDLDLAREQAVLLQEELRGRLIEQQNKRMYVLSVVTAIFLPLSFLTGVFGMNLGGLPGEQYQYGFPIVIAGMFITGLALAAVLKSKKWL